MIGNKTKSALAVILAAVFIAGCSLFDTVDDKSASLTFRVTGEMAAKIAGEARSARSADESGSDTGGLFFDIALKGDYEAAQTIVLKEGEAATFSDIPVDCVVWAEAVAYKIESDDKDGGKEGRTELYTGTSEKIMIQEGVNTLSLKMKKSAFTVTFDTNGGTVVAQQLVTKGEKASEPTAPTREGYGFAGWYSDSDLTSAFSFDTAITTDTTLYAKWTEDPLSVATAEIHIEINYGDGTYVTQLNFTKDGDTFTYTTGEMFADGGATLVKEGDTLTLHVVPMVDVANDEYNLVVDTASNTYTVDNDSTYDEKITLKSWEIDGTDVAGSWTKDTSNGF